MARFDDDGDALPGLVAPARDNRVVSDLRPPAVLPPSGGAPPSYAPTRRSVRPAPGQPVAVAVVPGNGSNGAGADNPALPGSASGAGVVANNSAVRRQSIRTTAPRPQPAYIPGERQTPAAHQPVARRLPYPHAPAPAAPPSVAAPITIAPAGAHSGNTAPQPRAVAPTPVVPPPAMPPASFAPGAPLGYQPNQPHSSNAALPYAAQPAQPGGAPIAGAAYPAQPGVAPAPQPAAAPLPAAKKRRRVRPGRVIAGVLALLLVAALAWPVGLLIWANGQINRVDALSTRAGTAGTTYLLAGTDLRGDDDIYDELGLHDGTSGARTDSILLLHQPRSGPTAMISIPRDTFVQIPGRGGQKINAAYAFGGPPLLVQTVEALTGMKVDHYVEIGMGGLANVVNAVGGVELCMDRTVDDWESQLVWTAGCHVADGGTALAFARMRMSDPLGDIGRADRQRQVIAAIVGSVADPDLLWHPSEQRALITAGLGALRVDEDMSILTFVRLALAFRAATGPDGVTGTPPISSLDFRPGGIGSAVQLDPATIGQFWLDLKNGNLSPGRVGLGS